MSDLYSLYKLHKIDEALHSLRQQAATLDTGREEEKRKVALEEENAAISGRSKELAKEQRDREGKQKTFEEKLVSLDKTLYDGSLVSPKEVANIEKEIVMYKELSEKNDERLLELYDESPPALELAENVQARLNELVDAAKAKRAEAVKLHSEIKTQFDTLLRERPDCVSQVDPDILEVYNDIRKHTRDVGMAVVTEAHKCDRCGVSIPEKTMELLKSDRLITCEDCRRILFKVVTED